MAAKTQTKKRGAASTQEATEVLLALSEVLGGLKKRRLGRGPTEDKLHDAFEQSELGPRHVAPLITLVLRGPSSVSELAERIGLTPATTSLLLGELSRAGFVERREDEADRRRTIVSVSPSVEEDVRPALEGTLAPLARGLGRMSAAQRAHLMDGLQILAEELGESGGNGG